MKTLGITAVLVLALAAAPILAQESGTNPPANAAPQAQPVVTAEAQAAAAEPDPGEEIICRRDRATGSLTRVNRVCKTRNEWNGVHDQTRANMDDMARNASGGRACRQDAMGGC